MTILTGADATPTLYPQSTEMRARLADSAAIGERLVAAVLPALGRNYDRSGLKRWSGRLYDGIVRRGAPGNTVSIQGSVQGVTATIGVDYDVIPYARWALEGRGPVRAKRAKALRFEIDGKVIYRRRVGPAPPHRVYALAPEDAAKAGEDASRFVVEGK